MTTLPAVATTTTTTTVTPPPVPASNAFKAIVRSLMPFVLSGAAALIARLGYHVTLTTTTEILGIVGGALTIVLHAAETQWPWVGIFLGYIGAPVYAPSTKVSYEAQIASLQAQMATLLAQQSEAKSPSPPSAPFGSVTVVSAPIPPILPPPA